MPNNTHAIRIISWNLQKGYRKSSLERQLEQVLALGPDFLCLQEVVWNARSIVERLLMKMRGQYRLIQRPVSPLVPKVLAMTGLIVRSDWHDKSAEFVRLENNETRENTKWFLFAQFSRGTQSLSVASVHQRAMVMPWTRRRSARTLKNHLERHSDSTIVCGDFNTGFPQEHHGLASILAPHFHWLTQDLWATCFWRRLEPTTSLPARIGSFIGRYLDIALPLDHAFITRDLADSHKVSVRALHEFDASDHIPVLVELEPEKR